jgi:hypothetical protein
MWNVSLLGECQLSVLPSDGQDKPLDIRVDHRLTLITSGLHCLRHCLRHWHSSQASDSLQERLMT